MLGFGVTLCLLLVGHEVGPRGQSVLSVSPAAPGPPDAVSTDNTADVTTPEAGVTATGATATDPAEPLIEPGAPATLNPAPTDPEPTPTDAGNDPFGSGIAQLSLSPPLPLSQSAVLRHHL